MATINMQEMRYLNLFNKITHMSTRFCFRYNGHIVFLVPRKFVSSAIGENGRNIKRMNEILGKRIKVLPAPLGLIDAKSFIKDLVAPTMFKEIEINENEIVITAFGMQSKAALIGRNKIRLQEMQNITENLFNRELRIA